MELLTGKQAAELIGVTVRRLNQICNDDGGPTKDSYGKYPACDFGEWMRRRHAESLGVQTNGERLDLNAERARLAKEQADKTQMENSRSRGESIPARQAAAVLEKVVMSFRSKVLSIPTKAAPLVHGCKSLADTRDKIEAALFEALNELANIDLVSLAGTVGSDKGSAAAKTDNKRVGRPRKKAVARGKRGTGAVAD